MNPYEPNKGLFVDFHSNWRFKDVSLGFSLCSQSYGEFRENYLLLCLGFWQLSIGFRL